MADQQHALDLHDGWNNHDRAGLSTLTPAQLQQQVEARRILHEYVDDMWEAAKAAGLDPAIREDYVAVAALRDLTMALYHDAADFEYRSTLTE